MASGIMTLTESMRFSSVNGSAALVNTLSFISNFTYSAMQVQELVITTSATSDLVISSAQFSNVQIFQLEATDTVRVNFGNILGGASYVSNASAGLPVTFLAFAMSGVSGPINLHLAYSGTVGSVTVRYVMAQ